MFVLRAGIMLSLLFALGGGAQATVLYNNLSASILGTDPISDDGAQFNSFTTDSTGAVDTIQLMLDTTGDQGGLVEVDIYDNLGNAPNNFVDNVGFVADADLTGSPAPFTFGALGEVLNPDSRYWVELTDLTGVSNIEWSYAVDDSGTGVAGEFHGNANGIFSNCVSSPYLMSVSNNGTGTATPGSCPVPPVPEPASLSILGLGLAGLGLLRRRRVG